MSGTALELLVGGVSAGALLVSFAIAASAWAGASGALATAGERLTDTFAALCALGGATVALLGFAGWLRPLPLLAAGALCAALGLACDGKRQLIARGADLAIAARAVRQSPPLAATCAVGLVLLVRGLALREVSWDGLLYHLTYPALWLERGAIDAFDAPGVWEQYESFPKAAEALFYLAMLPLHRDDLVYFVQLAGWLATGGALRAAALRLGTERTAADLLVLGALCSAGLAGYVAPANVEVLVAFACCAALAAAARALVARDPRALASLWLSLSLAGAIKITSLAYLPAGLVVTLFALRSPPIGPSLRQTARGLALGLAVLAPWYVATLIHCDNPLYPAALPGATEGPAAGSIANGWALRESSIVAQRTLPETLAALARAPWRATYPGPSWLFLWAIPLCLIVCAVATLRSPRDGRVRAAWVLAGGALALSVLYTLTPWNGVFYQANTRFLMPATIAALLGASLGLSLWPRALGTAVATLTAAVSVCTLIAPAFWTPVDWLGVPGMSLLALAVLLGPSWSWFRARSRALQLAIAALSCALAFAGLGSSSWSDHVAATVMRGADPNRQRYAALWRTVDALPPSRIAYVVGGADQIQGWLFYPLHGSRLQHRVVYVDVERRATRACRRRGVIRERPDRAAWLRRVETQRIDYVVATGAPLETTWIRATPAAFELQFEADGHALYRVDATALHAAADGGAH